MTAFKILISVFLLGAAIYLLDVGAILSAARSIQGPLLVMAAVVCFIQYIPMFFRWQILSEGVGASPTPRQFLIYLYSNFLNVFTPANIGGDVYRFAMLRRLGRESMDIVPALIKERLLGLLSFFLMFQCAFLASVAFDHGYLYHKPVFLFSWLGVTAATMAFFCLPMLGGIFVKASEKRPENRFLRWLIMLQNSLRFGSIHRFLFLMGFSMTAVLIWIGTVKVVSVGLQISIPSTRLGSVVVLAELVRLIPVSIQGIGIREGAYASLFAGMGMAPESGFLLGAVSYLVLSLTLVLCGLAGPCISGLSTIALKGRKK